MSGKTTSRFGAGSESAVTARPTIDSARKRLGGRPSTPSARAPGSLVLATMRGGTRRVAVVLWASERHCDVWLEDGVARRLVSDAVSVGPERTPEALSRVAAEMLIFSRLAEGDLVRWERATGIATGCIVEKCRYGAIIVTRDGKLVAVGFRKLWPAVVRGCA